MLVTPTNIQAQLYKWKDKNGVTRYSNIPPTDGETQPEVIGGEIKHSDEYYQQAEQKQSQEKEQQLIEKEAEKQEKEQEEKIEDDIEKKENRFNSVNEGMSKAEVLKLCGHPDLRETSNVYENGYFTEDWTYFLDNDKMLVIRFGTWAGKSKVKKIFSK